MLIVQAMNIIGDSTQIVARALGDLSPDTWQDLVREIGSIQGTRLVVWDKKPTLQYLHFTYDGGLDVESLKINIGHILEARGLEGLAGRFIEWDIGHIWQVEVLIGEQVWNEERRWHVGQLLRAAFNEEVAVAWGWPPYKRTIIFNFPYPPTAETFATITSSLAE